MTSAWELTTVADDGAVAFSVGGPEVRVARLDGLRPGTEHELAGLAFRTLPRPPGERLATVAAVNDLHLGEVECGVLEGLDLGPVLRSRPGEDPYPEVMSRAAAAEIAALGPDAVVVKGDVTASGRAEEARAFRDVWQAPFGARLHWVRGNHDAAHGSVMAPTLPQEVVLPGVTLALLDTARPGWASGQVTAEQLDWLDELGARAEGPVLVFGHHHPWRPDSRTRPEGYFGISPDDSERLAAVVARRPSLLAYLAGHTHRNRVRRFTATGSVPWVEVSAVKDFPGAWAEYRVFEGGVLQVFHRIEAPEALAWSERTRALFGGLYPTYAFGRVEDRCFPIALRRGSGRRFGGG